MLSIRLLGPPEVFWEEQPLSISRRQPRGLLYCLALYLQPVQRDRIGLVFWPDQANSQVRRKLSHLISELRSTLPIRELLYAEHDSIHLNQRLVTSDTLTFVQQAKSTQIEEQLAAARLYRGPLLEDFRVTNCPEFDAWMESERRTFEIRYAQLLEVLIHYYTSQGEYTAAIPFAERIVSLDLLNETNQLNLILLYNQIGNREAALIQYQHCIDLLQREAGLPPSIELQNAQRAIIENPTQAIRLFDTSASATSQRRTVASSPLIAPSLGEGVCLIPQEQEAVEPIQESNPQPREVQPTWAMQDFVGREDDLQFLQQILLRTPPFGQFVILFGESGVGKTALIEHTMFQPEIRSILIQVGTYPGGEELPLAPINEAMRKAIATIDHAVALLNQIPAIYRNELLKLLPELREHLYHTESNTTGSNIAVNVEPNAQLSIRFEALCHLIFSLANLLPNGLVLLIDNLQWLDTESIQWLTYLGTHISEQPLFVLLTCQMRPEVNLFPGSYQKEETSRYLDNLRYTLGERGKSQEHLLEGFSDEEISQLIPRRLLTFSDRSKQEQRRWIAEFQSECGGNAALVCSVITHLYSASFENWRDQNPVKTMENFGFQSDHGITQIRHRTIDEIDWSVVVGNPALQQVVHRRLLLLSYPARNLLEICARQQMHFTIDDVWHTMDTMRGQPALAEDQVVSALSELVGNGLLYAAVDGITFKHGIIRRLLLENIIFPGVS
ncbi:MAG: AAA family ATPase [Chloroflexota bacterium]